MFWPAAVRVEVCCVSCHELLHSVRSPREVSEYSAHARCFAPRGLWRRWETCDILWRLRTCLVGLTRQRYQGTEWIYLDLTLQTKSKLEIHPRKLYMYLYTYRLHTYIHCNLKRECVGTSKTSQRHAMPWHDMTIKITATTLEYLASLCSYNVILWVLDAIKDNDDDNNNAMTMTITTTPVSVDCDWLSDCRPNGNPNRRRYKFAFAADLCPKCTYFAERNVGNPSHIRPAVRWGTQSSMLISTQGCSDGLWSLSQCFGHCVNATCQWIELNGILQILLGPWYTMNCRTW